MLECEGIAALDSLASAHLLRTVAEARNAGVDLRLGGIEEGLRHLLDEIDPAILDETVSPPRRHPLEVVGARTVDTADGLSQVADLVRETGAELTLPFGRRGIKWGRALQQMNLVGASAMPIVVFISLLIGVVLALNGAAQLRQFGASIFIANLVAISMTREMGPLLTAVIVSGRSGSAIAAEIGTMVISEEIDAMNTMALSPIRFLVVPKIVALLLMMPLLTVMSSAAGIFGGYLVGIVSLDLGSDVYLSQTVQALLISDVASGLVKSIVFGLIIGFVGVHRGFRVRGGPESVGLATTSAVVTSIIMCIIANALFTAFFYYTR